MEDKYNRIVRDYLSKFSEISLKESYSGLYEHKNKDFALLITKIHQNLNDLIGFMNVKAKSNHHYNAGSSRELIELIEIIDELEGQFKNTNYNFILDRRYKNFLKYAESFLSASGGSPIPEDYTTFKIIKYDPILDLQNKNITIKDPSASIKLQLIGSGAYAIVQKYKDPFYDKLFAMKKLKSEATEREKERFNKEYRIMKCLRFPYILEVYGFDEAKQSYLMEFCDTDLEKYISKKNDTLTFPLRKKIALQMLYGLNYIHSKGYLHRDISYRNILIKEFDGGAITLKLSDFGLVKDLKNSTTKSDSAYKGSIKDPTVDPNVDKFKDYNIKNEIYSIGHLLQFIFTGKKSIEKKNVPEYLETIVTKCTDMDLDIRYDNLQEIIDEVTKLN